MSEEKATFRVQAAYKSDMARRPNNEDFVKLWEPEDFEEREKNGCIYVVADGVGGASVGERASKYAAEKVVFEFTRPSERAPGERLRKVMKQANREIFNYAEDNDMRMATTLVAAVIRGNQLYLANVGDSRAYLIRGGEVTQLTRDHSLVGERVRDGSMTEAEAQASKIKNRLTRSIGGEPDVAVDVFDPLTLKAGDKILLCSDGLTRYALKQDLVEMTANGSAEQIAERLVTFAKKRGGADNVSVVVALYEPAMAFQPTVHLERPVEVTWENVTTQPVMPKYPGLGRKSRLPAGVYVSLGIAATLIIVAIGVLGIGMTGGLSGWFGTQTPTIVVPTTVVPPTGLNFIASPPDNLAQSTAPNVLPPTAVDFQPTAGDLAQIPSPTVTLTPPPILGVITCDQVIVRTEPIVSPGTAICVADGTPCSTLSKGDPVQILGLTVVEDNIENPRWFLILFTHPLNGIGNYWITASCVNLSLPEVSPLIPILNNLGTPIPTPIPESN